MTEAPETAELIARLRQTFQVTGDKWFGLAADRLAAQTQEIDEEHTAARKAEDKELEYLRRAEAAEARVRWAEAMLSAQAAAIEAATVERCAKVAFAESKRQMGAREEVCRGIAAAIRALAKEPTAAIELQKRPVAFRAPNGRGGWVVTADEKEAADVADALGADYQGLYVRAEPTEVSPVPAASS